MKIKTFLFLLLLFAIPLMSKESAKISSKSISLEYSPDYLSGKIYDCAIEENVLVKYLYINVPEGDVRVHVGDAVWTKNNSESNRDVISKLYDIKFERAGKQRVLCIAIYPIKRLQKETYSLEKISIRVEFDENLVFKAKQSPLLSSNINGNYVSAKTSGERADKVPFKSYLEIKVKENGVYKIDYKSVLNAGIDLKNISVGNIGLYSNAGLNLPLDTAGYLSYLYPGKVPYAFVGDGDDDFEDGEYIMFFGESPSGDSVNFYMNYDIYNNPFTDYRHYMVVFNEREPQRADNLVFSFQRGTDAVYNEKTLHPDSINPLLSGYGWAWKKFALMKDSGDFEYMFNLETPDISGLTGSVQFSFFFPSAYDTVTIEARVNDSLLGSIEHKGESRYTPVKFSFDAQNLKSRNTIVLTAKNTDNKSKSYYLSECRIRYKADLDYPSDILIKNGGFRYVNLSTAKMLYCFVKSGENCYLGKAEPSFEASLDVLSCERVFISEILKTPAGVRWVDNSDVFNNLDGCDILIIAGDNFREALIPYIRYRKSMGIEAKVFEMNEIADAFGFGVVSPAAVKGFLEFAFKEWSNFPDYLILLGSGSYDYKNRLNVHENRSIVPVYETGYGIFEEGLLSASTSQCVDRWYSLLTPGDLYMDIIPGRITVINRNEASEALLKVIDYETKSPSHMKNKAMVISDDEYGQRSTESFGETYFFSDAENLANLLSTRFPVRKIYLMDYFGSLQGDEEHWPDDPGYKRDVRFAISECLNEGAEYCFFYGHGAYYTLAHEHILLYPDDLNLFTNLYRYPVFLFGTCQAGQFDNDQGALGGEFQKLPKSGFAAVIASTRAIFGYESVSILYNSFATDLVSGGFMTIGEYYLSMINENRYFSTSHMLFGDPSMKTKRHAFDVSIEASETLNLGAFNMIECESEGVLNRDVTVDFHQPLYTDSHDYLHVLPYAYLYYDKTDGVLKRNTVTINETLSVHLTNDFEDRKYLNRMVVSAVSEDDSFIYSGIRTFDTRDSSEASQKDGEITFASENRVLKENSILPTSYELEVRFLSKLGVYMGNLPKYLSYLKVRGDASVSEENKVFSETNGYYCKNFTVNSNQDEDTIETVIFDSDLNEFRESIILKHNSKAKSEKSFNLYPNPFSESFYISFASSSGGTMKWMLVDSKGFIASSGEEIISSGYNSIRIYPDNRILDRIIEAGLYMFIADFRYYGKSGISREQRKVVKL
ncbi:MAG: C25 family cysteine peptidase [bacterium]|nr:C25 family cysteine peptidase [bacterium]